MDKRALKNPDEIGSPSNDGAKVIASGEPYRVAIRISGSADILFHRWSVDAVAAKAKAAKGSAEKKSDDVESYVWRDLTGSLCLPGEYVRGAIINAARFHQDPRSPRKSAMDLFRAGVVSLTELGSFGVKDWDYLDRRRVQVQRSGVTRTRPALRAGWNVEHVFLITTPEYISPDLLLHVANRAGVLIGVGDFRPTFGRFGVTHFEVLRT
jgi:hypothetical protein